MESDRFDALTARLTAGMSRRRGVALLGLLGLSGVADTVGAKKKKKKKKGNKDASATTPSPACTPACGSRTCGDNGCGGSCGACSGDLVCRNGACACPEGMELCGGRCYPVCQPMHPTQVVSRHPVTCNCCVRPGHFTCPDHGANECCAGGEYLPCCAGPCNPAAVNGNCPPGFDPFLGFICHYDVDCEPGYRCSAGIDPRTCEPIPG